MVSVAQSVERQVVVLVAVGSIPTAHPNFKIHTTMNFELFWGLCLFFLGLSIIINILFGIAIPVIRLIAGGLLIYTGVSMITETNHRTKPVRSSPNYHEIKFEKKTIDLSSFKPDNLTESDINIVCGSAKLRLNPDVPTKLVITSVASHTDLPNGSTIPFGSYTYSTHESESPLLILNIRVVTGSLKIVS